MGDGSNKTLVLITGTTQGLGLELSRRFREFDCICLNRRKSKGKDLIVDLAKPRVDLRNVVNLISSYETVIFISNASTVEPVREVRDIEEGDLDYAINVNFLNPLRIILKVVKSQKKFVIVNITTGAAFTSNTKLGVYSATKAGMHRIVSILEVEEADNNDALLIKNFDPGRMKTRMQKIIAMCKKTNICEDLYKESSEVANELYEMIMKVMHEKI